jgi:hypothetical protein
MREAAAMITAARINDILRREVIAFSAFSGQK